METDFAVEWSPAADRVRAACHRQLNDAHLAEDVFQATAVRAWRGYPNFQRRSSFLTWVLGIAKHEIARAMDRRRVYEPLEAAPEPEARPDEPANATLAPGAMSEAIGAAHTDGSLVNLDVDVLRGRLEANGDATWEDIGCKIGISAAHCAVVHFRAVTSLRQFIFRHRPQLLGGRNRIERAFASALIGSGEKRLTKAEAEAFRNWVLVSNEVALPRGQLTILRAACTKVAFYLLSE